MASPSDTIIITDDEELPSLEPGSSRPRRVPRLDYCYRDFESMIVESVADETDTIPSRKRKRTETKEPSTLENAVEELRGAVSHKMQRLQDKNRILRDELRQERERHQKTQEELSQQREKHILECKICYMQPDRWVLILCGHMVCRPCAGSLGTMEKCPICRVPITGYIGCYPFAG
ncbi:uncharacterized protein N7479_001736 [Penicillium vulpinum]|uniref:RING-type domain-containing protein n=1 Tax=Penicillium vulpinum TaxID=29845 RepID=A0A1V6QXT4_9EURO|nr:uncharacterized protein N7479_001736 [Penicillium vulpinum]KAJ5971818.1 hypothetical protein N7479_001736 [Penicillium vulpinum]OQD93998.1 hypothetical protein PENVUL_c160G02920 [Penicillium vulpinum]